MCFFLELVGEKLLIERCCALSQSSQLTSHSHGSWSSFRCIFDSGMKIIVGRDSSPLAWRVSQKFSIFFDCKKLMRNRQKGIKSDLNSEYVRSLDQAIQLILLISFCQVDQYVFLVSSAVSFEDD